MPAQPAWLLQLPELIANLERISAPVLDRAGFELLFGVRRRRAIELMHHFGGFQAGRTFLIERRPLIATLQQALASADYQFQFQRKQRLSEFLELVGKQHAARRVAIPVEPAASPGEITLMPGVELLPGHLHVDFQSPRDLLTKLFALSQNIANDFEGFCQQAGTGAA